MHGWTLVLILFLLAIYSFFSFCLLQRLQYTRDLKKKYVARLHVTIGESTEYMEDDTKNKLFGKYWYAWATQMATHCLIVLVIIIYLAKAVND